MKNRDLCRNIEEFCKVYNSIPLACPTSGPLHDLVTAMWRVRDDQLSMLVDGLAVYRLPETASVFARACAWEVDSEVVWWLPDGRLLVGTCDCDFLQVMTEDKFLSYLAHRVSLELVLDDRGIIDRWIRPLMKEATT